MKSLLPILLLLLSCLSPFETAANARDYPGTRKVDYFGYRDCVELKNENTRVVLGHHAGGRVLEYSLNGVNAIWLNPKEAGRITDIAKNTTGGSSGGRFDIGPEYIIPRHPKLWNGQWMVEVSGPRSARMISQKDDATGVQLVREVSLAEKSSKLTIKQTIKNVSDRTTEWCHWSRTFAPGFGFAVVPISEPSRFPNKYIQVESRNIVNIAPRDPNIKLRGKYLLITGPPQFPKLGFDSYDGWFAYLMPNDVMFVKKYPTFPDRVYNEVAGLTLSIWYPNREDLPVVELEPIGPREKLKPGESASFTETWFLLPKKFPKDANALQPDEIAEIVSQAK